MKSIAFWAIVIFAAGCTPDRRVITPVVKPVTEAVYASGYLVARNEYQVISQVEGYVVEKVARDGEAVRKGDPVLILESGQQSARFDFARKNFLNAQRNYQDESPLLRETASAVNAARRKLSFDSINFVRFRNLREKNATTQAEYDRYRLLFETSRSELATLTSRYERLRDQLRLELENARSQLAVAANESGKSVIRSEIDGRVFNTLKEPGEFVRRGEAVAVVGERDEFFLQLAVDELDIRRVRAGQDVLVTIDAFGDSVWRAVIEKVYPFVNRQQQSVRVDAALNGTIPALFSGLAVEANIIIRRKDNALVVPVAALKGGDSLVVETDEGLRHVRVERGLQTLEEVEVISGIEPGSRIVVDQQD